MQELLVSFEVFSNGHKHLLPYLFIVISETNSQQLVKHLQQLIVGDVLALLRVEEKGSLN